MPVFHASSLLLAPRLLFTLHRNSLVLAGVAALIVVALPSISLAQPNIYRCADGYTNNAAEADAKGCLRVDEKKRPSSSASQPAPPFLAGTTLFEVLGVVPDPPPPPKRELNWLDRLLFESCMDDAAKNPTSTGVNAAISNCQRRFEQ